MPTFGDAGAALTLSVTSHALASRGSEKVADDARTTPARFADDSGAFQHAGVGVVDHHRAAVNQRLPQQLELATLRLPVVAQVVLADVHMARSEALTEERAFPGARQADEDYHLGYVGCGRE